jgi:ABC-2 type transport system ATP-binding protein
MLKKVIRLQEVGKAFGEVRAVDSVSFEVQDREIFALLGPNGAGKSTLVRMMIGMLPPDHGAIEWLSEQQKVVPLQAHEIGYLPEDRGLYRDQKVSRILEYFGRLRAMTRDQARAAAREWAERMEVSQYLDDKLETLSKGNQQKVQVAAAVLHRPRVAILDEPFSGLDPLNQEMMLDVIRHLRDEGTTVILSAHQLELVERLADHVYLLAKGRRVISGTVRELKASAHGGRRLQISFANAPSANAVEQWRHESGVPEVEQLDSGAVQISLSDARETAHWLSQAACLGEIISFRGGDLSLHEIYLRALNYKSVSQPREEVAV